MLSRSEAGLTLHLSLSDIMDVLASLILFLLILMKISPLATEVMSIIEIALGIVLLAYLLMTKQIAMQLLLLVALTIFLLMINFLYVGAVDIRIIIKVLIVHLPVGMFIALNQQPNENVWRLSFWIITAFLMYRYWSAADGYHIFYNTSRNMISAYVIESFFLYAFVLNKHEKTPSILYTISIFLICTIVQSRSGIIVGAFLLVGDIVYRIYLYGKQGSKTRIAVLFFAICAFLCLCFLLLLNIEPILERFFPRFTMQQGISTSDSDEIRMVFLWDYLNACSKPGGLLFGVDTKEISSLMLAQGGNLHNSFLQTHSYLGLAGIVAILWYAFLFFRRCINRRMHILALAGFAFFLRAFLDYCFPGAMGDIAVWCIMIATIYEGKSAEKTWVTNKAVP